MLAQSTFKSSATSLAHWFISFALLAVFLSLSFAVQAGEWPSERFVIKLKNAVELSSNPSVRRLEKEGEFLNEVLARNGVDANWLRAGVLGSHIMRWNDSVRPGDRQSLMNRLASDPEVESVFEDEVFEPMMQSNDPRLSSQWALLSSASPASARFDGAWDVARGTASVVVAVVDTGVVYQTPELQGRLLAGYDFISKAENANDGDGRDADASDPGDWVDANDLTQDAFNGCPIKSSSWHGTFIASQIAANTNDSTGVASGNWNSKILPVRVSGKCKAYSSDVFDGMVWAAGLDVPGVPVNSTPAQVISVSLGAPVSCNSLYQQAINRINAKGVVVSASAGNGGTSSYLPANCSKVISVGALDKDGSRAFYSAIGSDVDLMAPGGYKTGLVGVGNSGKTGPQSASYVINTGTSFSAPLVAAAASLLKQVNPDLSPDQVENLLKSSARPFLAPNGNACQVGQGKAICDCTASTCGAGMLDVEAAVTQARAGLPVSNPAVYVSGSRLILDGQASTAVQGQSLAIHRWVQVSGLPVMDGERQGGLLDLQLPSSSGDLVFKLTVEDSVGRSHSSFASLRVGNSKAATLVPEDRSSQPAPSASSIPTPADSAPTGGQAAVSSGEGGGGGGGGSNPVWLAAVLGLLLIWRGRVAEVPS